MNEKLRYMLIILTVFIFTSCTKDNQQLEMIPEESKMEAINFSTKTLSFANENELYSTISSLILMDAQEREQWLRSHGGFVSQSEAALLASEQIAQCKSINQMLALKDQYSQFIFNDTDPTDLVPYEPTSNFGSSWVCNAYGDVEVGGKVVNLNNIKAYSETFYAKIEQENLTRATFTNNLYIKTTKRKVWADTGWVLSWILNISTGQFEISQSNAVLGLKLATHYRDGLGIWHTYNNLFVITGKRASFSGFAIPTQSCPPLTVINGGTYSGVHGRNYFFPLGHLAIQAIPTNNVKGTVEIYTEAIGVANKGTLIIDKPKEIFNLNPYAM